jgi:hypothetical protein
MKISTHSELFFLEKNTFLIDLGSSGLIFQKILIPELF